MASVSLIKSVVVSLGTSAKERITSVSVPVGTKMSDSGKISDALATFRLAGDLFTMEDVCRALLGMPANSIIRLAIPAIRQQDFTVRLQRTYTPQGLVEALQSTYPGTWGEVDTESILDEIQGEKVN